MKKILIFDGAMGTRLQNYGYKNKYPLINLKNPKLIEEIHLEYLKSGANIVKTNTFNADINSLGGKYDLDEIKEINKLGVNLAKTALKKFNSNKKPLYIAGNIGPSIKRYYETSKNSFIDSAFIQASEMIKGKLDFIILETMISLVEVKLLLKGIEKALEFHKNSQKENFKRPKIIVSITPSDSGDLILDGRISDLENIKIIDYIGLNCGSGVNSFKEGFKKSKQISFLAPSLGLPVKINKEYVYNKNISEFSSEISDLIKGENIKFIGGCCGTDYKSIKQLASDFRLK